MKMFFLGTGSAQGCPSLFGDSPLDREALLRGGPNLRLRSSVLLDGMVRVDLPPDALAQSHRYPSLRLQTTEHLLFTHSHDDHFAVRELQYLAPLFTSKSLVPLQIYATNGLVARIAEVVGEFYERPPLHLHAVEPGISFAIGNLSVLPIQSHHKPDEVCLNFLFEREGRRLLYATDTGWYAESTWRMLDQAGLHMVVLECGNGIVENGYDGHLSLDACVAFRNRLLRSGALVDGGRVLLTHLGTTGGILHEELSAIVEPLGMEVAYDGLEVDV